MRFIYFCLFFFVTLAHAQVPEKLTWLRDQGFLNTVPVLIQDNTGGTADQSHGQCKIFLSRTPEGDWSGSLAFLAGEEDAPSEVDSDIANELTLWALLHENAHCLWYAHGGPTNFTIPWLSSIENNIIGSVLLNHRAMSELVLSESFADIYASMLFKKVYPHSTLLIKIAHAREKAASQKKDNIFQVNVADDAIRWVAKNRLPHSSSPLLWFQIAAQQASQNMLNDFTHRSVRVRNELVSESYFRSLILAWWEGFADDKECWWQDRPVEVAKLIYKKVGCQPPAPYSSGAKGLNQVLEFWFKSEKQQQERYWVLTKISKRLP